MRNALKAEFRKIFSVRSTYIVTGLSMVLLILVAFYIEGIKSTGNFNNPNLLAGEITSGISFISIIIALIGVLLITHEYRYNTINYTLVASRSRSHTLFAKILAVSAYAIVGSLLVSVLSPALTALGLHLRGVVIAHQSLPVLDLLWRAVFYGWGISMSALLMATLLRNQVAAIVALFLVPSTVEQLLGFLLKKGAVYLPFRALSTVINNDTLTHVQGAMVALAYLVGGWAIAFYLFRRRDAN